MNQILTMNSRSPRRKLIFFMSILLCAVHITQAAAMLKNTNAAKHLYVSEKIEKEKRYQINIVCSHDVTAAMLEEWNILLGIELYFYANSSFCSLCKYSLWSHERTHSIRLVSKRFRAFRTLPLWKKKFSIPRESELFCFQYVQYNRENE